MPLSIDAGFGSLGLGLGGLGDEGFVPRIDSELSGSLVPFRTSPGQFITAGGEGQVRVIEKLLRIRERARRECQH